MCTNQKPTNQPTNNRWCIGLNESKRRMKEIPIVSGREREQKRGEWKKFPWVVSGREKEDGAEQPSFVLLPFKNGYFQRTTNVGRPTKLARTDGKNRDATGCPNGLARDNVLVNHSPCNVSISSFIAIAVVTTAVYGLMIAYQYSQWRRIHLSSVSRKRNQKQRPVIILLGLVQFIILILFYVLIGTNRANASNGGSIALLAAYCSPFIASSILSLFRLIRLGHRILVSLNFGAV